VAKYGPVSPELHRTLVANGATRAYAYQKRNADQRGIAWCFNLATWWAVWEASGRWEDRGRGAERYCMARQGDSGAYEPANVLIVTNLENLKFGAPGTRKERRDGRVPGVRQRSGRGSGWSVDYRGRYFGTFATKAEALEIRALAERDLPGAILRAESGRITTRGRKPQCTSPTASRPDPR
jgi:hypothetical protein